MSKKFIFIGLLLAGVLLILAACASPTPAPTQAPAQPTQPPAAPTTAPAPTAVPQPTEAPIPVPHEDEWKGSGHADVKAEAFVHWNEDDPAEIPTSCAKCHSSAGNQDFLGADGSEAGKVDKAHPAIDNPGVTCETCHNDKTLHMASVTFPSGAVIENPGPSGRCMVCHQGRESTVSVNKLIETLKAEDPDKTPAPVVTNGVTTTLGFRNVHYFAAAATLYGTMVKGGYEYDGKTYDAKNTHVEGFDSCAGCHDPHTLQVKVDQCAQCHEGVKTVDDLKNVRMISSAKDYDGDGDVKEGMAKEIEGLQTLLYAEIQKYAKDKAGAGIVYDPATYPYFMLDADGDGKADTNDQGAPRGYNKWTPRLLKAAYNYQVSVKDPGAFAHGNKYIVQLLYDSIEDMGGDVSKLARTDAGHFAGDTMPFRDWDAADITAPGPNDYTVPYRCVKCHTAEGVPTFLKNGGTVVVDGRGSTLTTGVGAMHSSNGFMCSTCHNEEKWPERYAIASVVFPSGKSVSFGGKDADGAFVADESNLCILCHQGRESTLSVNNALKGKEDDKADKAISFKNIHYFGAGATLFGSDAAGAYQYDKKDYNGLNQHPVNKCKDCHDVHTQEVKEEGCKACHGDKKPEEIRMAATDWDGDGDTAEGVKGEIDSLAEALYAQIQAYAKDTAGAGVVYSSAAYPYFFLDADGDGKPDKNDQGANVAYNAWTPRLLKAAFNYQYSQKDPGAFVHNPQYVIQFMIDSIGDLGGNVSGYTRPDYKEPPKVEAKPAANSGAAGGLVSAKAAAAPKLDGVADDAAWKDAAAVKIDVAGGENMGSTTAELKSVYSGDMVYFLVTYADPTLSEQRSPWKLNADGTWAKLKDPNDKGGDNNVYYEDKFAMLWPVNNSVPNFEKVGCMAGCHVSDGTGKPYGNKYFEAAGALADLWHWKSVRNDGQVDDQYVDNQVYDKEKFPEAGRHSDKNDGGGYKDNQTEDKKLPAFAAPDNKPAPPYYILDSEKVAFDPAKYKAGDEVAGIYKAPFKGDRGDLSAGWKYADGKWTLEFGRKLTTGSPTDVQFDDLKKAYPFAVAVFDNAQVRHAFQTGSTPFTFQP